MASRRRESGRFFSPSASFAASCKATVAGRKSVGMAQAEQQENIRRPRPNAFDGDKRAMGVLGDERAEPGEIEPLERDRRSQGAQGAYFRARQAARSQSLIIRLDHALQRSRARGPPPGGRISHSALAVETCWATMIRASPAKPGACRRSWGVCATASIAPTVVGSSASSAATASVSAAWLSIRGPG